MKLNHLYITVSFVTIMVAGCNSIFITPINKIIQNPRDYNGKQVAISGRVTEIFSLIFVKYFIVQDKTGEIVVVTG